MNGTIRKKTDKGLLMKPKFVQVVSLDERGFIRTYRDFDTSLDEWEKDIANFVVVQVHDSNVQKVMVSVERA